MLLCRTPSARRHKTSRTMRAGNVTRRVCTRGYAAAAALTAAGILHKKTGTVGGYHFPLKSNTFAMTAMTATYRSAQQFSAFPVTMITKPAGIVDSVAYRPHTQYFIGIFGGRHHAQQLQRPSCSSGGRGCGALRSWRLAHDPGPSWNEQLQPPGVLSCAVQIIPRCDPDFCLECVHVQPSCQSLTTALCSLTTCRDVSTA